MIQNKCWLHLTFCVFVCVVTSGVGLHQLPRWPVPERGQPNQLQGLPGGLLLPCGSSNLLQLPGRLLLRSIGVDLHELPNGEVFRNQGLCLLELPRRPVPRRSEPNQLQGVRSVVVALVVSRFTPNLP